MPSYHLKKLHLCSYLKIYIYSTESSLLFDAEQSYEKVMYTCSRMEISFIFLSYLRRIITYKNVHTCRSTRVHIIVYSNPLKLFFYGLIIRKYSDTQTFQQSGFVASPYVQGSPGSYHNFLL
jgi:hypothetical protein